MVVMSTHDETLHPRGQAANAGQFRAKENSAPVEMLNPRAELDDANALYHDNTDQIREQVALYLRQGMPQNAHRVEFECSDQGDYVYPARAFSVTGEAIDTDEDRWADVGDVVSYLGYPDDNRALFGELFGELFTAEGRGVFAWTRTEPTGEDDGQAILDRISQLGQARHELGAGSQTAAVLAVRRMMPEGAKATLTWGDQGGPDYLTVDKITLADGSIVDDWDSAEDAGIDWDEIDMAASDIRDATDPALRRIGNTGMYFELDQKPA